MFTKSLTATLGAAALAVTLTTAIAQAGSARTGTFVGENRHTVTGGVSIVDHDGGKAVRLGPDFFLDGAPDPKVGFGSGGTYTDGTLIGKVGSNTGEQLFPIPAGMDVSGFDTVFIWCERFSVSLGKATIY